MSLPSLNKGNEFKLKKNQISNLEKVFEPEQAKKIIAQESELRSSPLNRPTGTKPAATKLKLSQKTHYNKIDLSTCMEIVL